MGQAKILLARDDTGGNQLYYQVHLDVTRLKNGAPDPHWIREYRFPRLPPGTFGIIPPLATYQANCLAQMQTMASAEKARLLALEVVPPATAGTALTAEGTAF